jgi:ribosomal protein S18 acetylase RimI-like enzyme
MSNDIQFKLLSWDDLRYFLAKEDRKINRDVDREVRFMNYMLFCEQVVEGLYLDGQLVGFARWDRRNNHLSNLYVTQEARGMGIAKKFINERMIKSLYVMPHNDMAKQLYAKLGFILSKCAVPTREFMFRPTGLPA